MGSDDNITNSTFEDLAKKKVKSADKLKDSVQSSLEKNVSTEIEDSFTKAANAWGQSIEEAKSNTLKLLKTSK
ncbi:MAG: hypothetical protein Q7R44_01080 [bacterium]|nr:hypothetical protein [bacterium]